MPRTWSRERGGPLRAGGLGGVTWVRVMPDDDSGLVVTVKVEPQGYVAACKMADSIATMLNIAESGGLM